MGAGVTSLFKKIDEILFKQIDQLKGSRPYQTIVSKLGELPQSQQQIVGQLLAFSVIIVPIALVLFVFIGNFKLRDDIETRKTILNLIHQYAGQKNQLIEIGKSISSSTEIASQSDASNMIRDILDRKKIDAKKIGVDNFLMGTSLKGIAMAEIDVSFRELSINEFTVFLQVLLQHLRKSLVLIQYLPKEHYINIFFHALFQNSGPQDRNSPIFEFHYGKTILLNNLNHKFFFVTDKQFPQLMTLPA